MLPSVTIRTIALIVGALSLSLLLAACGQKGPLYLPDDKAAAERYGTPEPIQNVEEEPPSSANDNKRDS
nr:lipoprotein [Halomonas halocynthiae]